MLKSNNGEMSKMPNARIDEGIANLRKELMEKIEPLQRDDEEYMNRIEKSVMNKVEEVLGKRLGERQTASQRTGANKRFKAGDDGTSATVENEEHPSLSVEGKQEDMKRKCAVMATGFPNETYSKEIQDFREGVKEKMGMNAGTVITFGRVTNSAIIEFRSPPEAVSLRELMRREANQEFKGEDGEMHKIYFGPCNTKSEDRRQMIQRRIRNALRKKLEEGGVNEEEVYIERGKGTVRVGRSLVATVARDADVFQLVAEALRKLNLEEPSVRGEMQVGINRV